MSARANERPSSSTGTVVITVTFWVCNRKRGDRSYWSTRDKDDTSLERDAQTTEKKSEEKRAPRCHS